MEKKELTVEEYTTPNPKFVKANDSLQVAWDVMTDAGIRHVLVKNEESEIKGLLSHRDVTTFSQADFFKDIKVQEVMSKDIFTVSPETPLYKVALRMSSDKIGSAVVVDPTNDYVGIFTATDALNALVEVLRDDQG